MLSVCLAARRFLVAQGCTDTEAAACQLALVEACNNAVQNVRPAAAGLPVRVEVLCGARQIELRITDHTAAFPWPAQVELPSTEQESGRGLYLIVSVMDSVTYLPGASENVLVLRKDR